MHRLESKPDHLIAQPNAVLAHAGNGLLHGNGITQFLRLKQDANGPRKSEAAQTCHTAAYSLIDAHQRNMKVGGCLNNRGFTKVQRV